MAGGTNPPTSLQPPLFSVLSVHKKMAKESFGTFKVLFVKSNFIYLCSLRHRGSFFFPNQFLFWFPSLQSVSHSTEPGAVRALLGLCSVPLSMSPTEVLNSPSTNPWEQHSSLISTWTLNHGPQLFECDHPTNLLSSKWSICQICAIPV